MISHTGSIYGRSQAGGTRMCTAADRAEMSGVRISEVHHVPTGDVVNFRDDVRSYGRHQWDVRLHGGALTGEELAELRIIFTDPSYLTEHGLDPYNVFFAGLRGGWLVVDQEISMDKVRYISELVRMFHRSPVTFHRTYVPAMCGGELSGVVP
jgi:hypothetical protein